MNPQTEQALREHAEAEYPNESCGFVLVVKGKERYMRCRNTADNPRKRFVIHEEDVRNAEDAGDVLAVVHSHPATNAELSVVDRMQCANGVVPWIIVQVLNGKSQDMRTYKPDGYQAPLVGRPFVHGILDCYSLVKDYYDRELHIELPEFERKDNWWNEGQDLYMANFAKAGCAPITDAIRVGDIILMQVRAPKVNHAAVYIGESTMLHHMYNRLSTREIYGGWYQEITRVIVRHRDMK